MSRIQTVLNTEGHEEFTVCFQFRNYNLELRQNSITVKADSEKQAKREAIKILRNVHRIHINSKDIVKIIK